MNWKQARYIAHGQSRDRLPTRYVKIWLAAILIGFLSFNPVGAVQAQTGTFDSTSNGSDGALNLTAPGTIIFDPRSFNPPLDQDGDHIYHFTTINIAAGVTVRMSGQVLHGPIYWLASGDVKIDGIINLSGEQAPEPRLLLNNGERTPMVPGAGGYAGGIGYWGILNSSPQPGAGPGGGQAGPADFSGSVARHGRGAGHAVVGACPPTYPGGAAYGNDFLVPLIGGSGGGGGHFGSDPYGAGGGSGGGALLVASSTTIQVNGQILANGGLYQSSRSDSGGFGGAGSGGAVRLVAPTVSGTGKLEALGVLACNPHQHIVSSRGRIRIEAFQHNFTGAINPAPIRAAPFQLFLPTTAPPTVRVLEIGGNTVSDRPVNNFASPDVTVSTPTTTTITLEARYVPVGATVLVVVIPENSQDQIYTSTPLVGTFERSMATVDVTLPSGYARIYLRAKWTP